MMCCLWLLLSQMTCLLQHAWHGVLLQIQDVARQSNEPAADNVPGLEAHAAGHKLLI